ncbi:MAG: hypothetical protein ABJD11_10955 [Gemmatimonadota bacterium]
MLENEGAPPQPNGNGGEQERLTELREIVLGPYRAELGELSARLDDPLRQAEEISRHLPAAISLRSRQDTALARAMAPVVETALQTAVRRNPGPLAEAIFPIIGPAIRRAITAAMRETVQSLNTALEQTISIRGVRWRWEAFRSGLSFAEVVLRHSLVYRVEQLLLIHRETGLLLQHVAVEGEMGQSPDMVAGMLTAIQDFARDSLRTGSGDTLETMELGDHTVWIEPGPRAVLAAVIRGTAPLGLRNELRAILEEIHATLGVDLARFKGDATAFAPTRLLLQSLLRSEIGTPGNRARRGPILAATAVLLTVLLIWLVPRIREQRRWNRYLDVVRETPGFVLTEAGYQHGRRFVSGLRDPLAATSDSLLRGAGFDPSVVDARWRPFATLEPALALRRAQAVLASPPTVTLALDAGRLTASGSAPHEWIMESRLLVRALPGITSFATTQLDDRGPASVASRVFDVEHRVFLFDTGSDQLQPEAARQAQLTAADMRIIENAARGVGLTATLGIQGSADGVGPAEVNAALRRSRAERARDALLIGGVPSGNLSTGTSTEPASDAGARPLLRRVSFSLSFRPVP